MKLSRIRTGERLMLGGAVALVVILSLDWFFLSTPDARLGRDPAGSPGWYRPDPDRPGKFLRVGS